MRCKAISVSLIIVVHRRLMTIRNNWSGQLGELYSSIAATLDDIVATVVMDDPAAVFDGLSCGTEERINTGLWLRSKKSKYLPSYSFLGLLDWSPVVASLFLLVVRGMVFVAVSKPVEIEPEVWELEDPEP